MAPQHSIRVLVVDDSDALRLGLRQVLSVFPDLKWVGESRDGTDVVEQCQRLVPEVILFDTGLTHIDVLQTIHSIREHFPLVQVIGITSFEEQPQIDRILKAGAAVCISKNAPISAIADSIRFTAQPQDPASLVNRTGRLPIL